jgi:hypothetical protein
MRSESLRIAYGGGGVAWRDGWTRTVRDRTRAFKCDTPLRAADHGRHMLPKSVTPTLMTRMQSRRSRGSCDEVGTDEAGRRDWSVAVQAAEFRDWLPRINHDSVHRKMAVFRQQKCL